MAGAATMAAGAGFKEEIGKSPLARVAIFGKGYNLGSKLWQGLQSLVAIFGKGCKLWRGLHLTSHISPGLMPKYQFLVPSYPVSKNAFMNDSFTSRKKLLDQSSVWQTRDPKVTFRCCPPPKQSRLF